MSDREFTMSEFGDLEDLALLVFGMMYLLLLLLVSWLLWFVAVCGRAVLVRDAHVHVARVFTGPRTICGHTSCPALAITGGRSIRVLQGFVFDVGIGVGRERPDSGD